MNSHAEHDTSDLTCKDCGNEYRTRKSLHVHRMKKHPRIPNPSTCELCNKVFFDETELVCHLKTHSNEEVFFHLREKQKQLKHETTQSSQLDDEDDDPEASSSDQAAVAAAAAVVAAAAAVTFPETNDEESLSCHICGQSFQDKRVLSKHLRMHENESEALADNPLAAMLSDTQLGGVDDNGSDYNYPTYQGQMVDGQYACDMCPKTFPVINALKVHRGWHFRSPDGRQVTDPSNMWQPDSIPQSKQRRSRMSNPPVCPYCKSTFASGNNLRRHIVEVHKRNEAKMARENGTVSDSVYIEKELECHTCGITFNTRPEWVDHKIQHARTMKPSTTFEWGCEICGKVFTRKERLLAHMVGHLNGKEDDNSVHSAGQHSGEMGDSRSSISSQSQSQQSQESSSILQQKLQQQLHHRQKQMLKQQSQRQRPVHQVGDEPQLQPDYEDDDEMDEDEDEEEEADGMNAEDDEDDFNNDQKSLSEKSQPAYSCDLCQVFFHTAKELRRHVTSHIITTAPEISIAETQANYNQKPSIDESSTKKPTENVSKYDDENADDNNGNDDDDDDVDEEEEEDDDERMETDEKPQVDQRQQPQVSESNAMQLDDDDDYNSEDGDENEESGNRDHGDSQRNDEEDDDDEEEEEDDDNADDDYRSNAQKNEEGNQKPQQSERQFNASSISVEGYKCRLCGKNTASALDMIQCMENHKTPNNSRCNECLLYFTDSNRLRLHENMCHPKNFF